MPDRRSPPWFLAALVLALSGACAVPPAQEPSPRTAPPRPAAAGPGIAYELVESEVTVRVYRDGPLAQFGHNHVIASTGLTGRLELREPQTSTRFELELPLATLTVDEPLRRAAAGDEFAVEVSAIDRDGTRRNMLGTALLDAVRFPVLRLESLAMETGPGAYRVTTRVSVAGRERDLVVPVSIELAGDALSAWGEFKVTHADLGLTPFSAAMGALRVREDMLVSFRLAARRSGGPA
jgi:hypothetical protein